MSALISGLCVGVGGAVGALGRYGLDTLITESIGRWHARRGELPGPRWPWGIVTVNILGAVLIALFAAFLAPDGIISVALITGLCGGFTTFSTAVVDAVRQYRTHRGILGVMRTFLLLYGAYAGAFTAYLLTRASISLT